MKYIKKIPKEAKFDYQDIFGGKHYHTKKRKYTIYRNTITSEKNNDEIQD